MRSSFKILFSIEVLNRFFGTGRWNEVKIIPLPETAKLIKQYELITRQIDNELLVIAKTDTTGATFHTLPLYEKFSFMLVPQSANYINYSNLPFSQLNTPVFNFHNLNGNEMGGKHFITKKTDDYTSTRTYVPGEFVKAPDGKIYESIRLNDKAGSIAPDDTEAEPALPADPEAKLYSGNFWVSYTGMQFVSGGDAAESYFGNEYSIEQSGGIYNFKTSVKQKNHKVQVYALNAASLQYDRVVVAADVNYDDNNDMVQVDMRHIPSGKYCVRVDDDVKFIYLNTGDAAFGVPMFVDIYNLPDTDAQAIIDAAQKPLHTRFTISFAARRVLWQYKTRTSTIDKIEDSGGVYLFKADGLRRFISLRPIPLSDTAIKTLVAKSGTLSIASPLPNPTADRLTEKQNEIYSTESFINF